MLLQKSARKIQHSPWQIQRPNSTRTRVFPKAQDAKANESKPDKDYIQYIHMALRKGKSRVA